MNALQNQTRHNHLFQIDHDRRHKLKAHRSWLNWKQAVKRMVAGDEQKVEFTNR